MESPLLRLRDWAQAVRTVVHHYAIEHRRLPNIFVPRTLNEKVLYRKLYDRSDVFVRLSDKVLVKDYVAERLGLSHVTPTLWHGTALPDDAATRWPGPIAIKSNFGSGNNIFVRPGDAVDWPTLRQRTAAWLATDFHPEWHETWYNRIDRQLLVEPLLADGAPLDDFRFLCFSGRARIIYVHRADGSVTFFTPDWRLLPVDYSSPTAATPIAPPPHLGEMIAAAEALALPFAFVRIDFYDLPEGPRFGEFTFSPNAGNSPFRPASFDRELGGYWTGPLLHLG